MKTIKAIQSILKEYEGLRNKLLNSKSYTLKELNIDSKGNRNKSKHNVSGVYIILDEYDDVVYVGRTTSQTILDRLGNQHVYGGSGSDLRNMLGRPELDEIFKYKCKYLEIDDAIYRSRFEHYLISILDPKYNK